MDVQVVRSLESCDLESKTKVFISGGNLSVAEKNQISRIERILEKKKMELTTAETKCFGDTLAILLVDKQKNLRGSYLLEQADINRLFVELDIVLMHDSYGEHVSR